MSILRDYQRQAVAAFWDTLSPEVNRVAIEMATGLGKTITFAGAIDEWLDQGPRTEAIPPPWPKRALVLVHTDELVRQAVEKIQAVTRGRWTIGVVKAGQNEVGADIVVASVATLIQPGRMDQLTDVGFIVVDECHHATAPSYVKILQHFRGFPETCQGCHGTGNEITMCPIGCDAGERPAVIPVLGVTATLARSDGKGLGEVWQDLAFSRSLTWGMRKGFLIDAVPWTIRAGSDPLAAMGNEDLDAMLADSLAPEVVVQAWAEKAWGPLRDVGTQAPSTVLFAPLVRSAEAFADAFNAAGIKAEVVHGKLDPAERKAILDRYEAGITTVICNAMVLTEGWDSPRTMCVIVARPTKSVPLFIQMIGRGLRPWLAPDAPVREDQRCTILVVQGATETLEIVADLSDHIGEVHEGQSFLAMEDEWDLGSELVDEPEVYAGPVRVEQWDALVQRSSKAWKYTAGGVPFLPTAKHGDGYVFVTEQAETGAHLHGWKVWSREPAPKGSGYGKYRTVMLATAPDLELALALAEDETQERGGDIGALLADKARPWRKAVPSDDMKARAVRLGLEKELTKIMASPASGKAGRLSDRIAIVEASRALDPVAARIKERG